MDIQTEIIKSIDLIVQKALEKYKDNDAVALVTAVNGELCTLSLNGAEYKVKNGIGVTLSPGNRVWVRIPSNNYKNMYIASKK